MKRVIHCPCGLVLEGDSEEAVIQQAQQHAKAVHGMDLTKEQAQAMVRPE